MRIVGLPKTFYHIARHPSPPLSPKAQERLRYLSCWQALRQKGFSSTQASHTISLPPSNLYRWQKRLKEEGLKGLEDKSRRPKKKRKPTWSPKLAVLELREKYPRWVSDGSPPQEAGLAGLPINGGVHPQAPEG